MSTGQVVGEPPDPGTRPPPVGPLAVLGDGDVGTGAVVGPGDTVVSVVPGAVVCGGDVVVRGGAEVVGLGGAVVAVGVAGAAGCWVAGAGAPVPVLAAVVDGGRT
jgi:hypothetical protein